MELFPNFLSNLNISAEIGLNGNKELILKFWHLTNRLEAFLYLS
jgi:hypothetical protein